MCIEYHEILPNSFFIPFASNRLILNLPQKPVPLNEKQSNGQHAHLSINPPTKQDAFLAGILGRLPALCAVSLPYEASYSRLRPWMGGDTVAWGTDHRSVPLRKIKAGHWEIRVVDATANMYVALAAFISAGLLGIQHDNQLHWKDASISKQNGEPLRLKDSSMRKSGINSTSPTAHKLPTSFSDALTLLDGNFDDIEAMMGSAIIGHYLSLKRSELAQLQSLSPNSVRDLFVELF